MGQLIKSFVQSEIESLDKVLFHYTSFIGLESIVASGQLWATNSHFLNDASEAKLILKLLPRSLKAWRPREREDYTQARDRLIEFLKKPLRTQHYLTSFSEASDSLSQWRAYCPHGGVCIGFRPGAIRRTRPLKRDASSVIHANTGLSKVRYLAADRKTRMRDATHELLEYLSLWASNWDEEMTEAETLDIFEDTVASFVCLYKDHGFSEEQEWRLIVSGEDDREQMTVHFRSSQSLLIPYVKLSLNGIVAHVDGTDRGISEIVIGPGPHMELNRRSIERLLMEHGINDAKVRCSTIPYRHW